ncbi:MAG: isoprenyl transferase [Christensenellaceae bacterium]|jgi:undecaprenyl diphosphate synthase
MHETIKLEQEKLPKHVAIIMDGNGRWAKARHMPRSFGHKRGVERVRDLVKMSSNLGIEVLTLYAFSTENWKRPKEEVGLLMSLFMQYLQSEIDELDENNVILRMLGDKRGLSSALQEMIEAAEKRTAKNTGLTLALAINYGGQDEILRTGAEMAQKNIAFTHENFMAHLYTKKMPPVDYVIRTSGEQRLSNFLIYQSAYAELYFTEVLWPDFTQEEYGVALQEYIRRDRRYGGL